MSTLIRKVCDDIFEKNNGAKHYQNIKQAFIFTHNVFFHKEATYKYEKKNTSFWIVRKSDKGASLKYYPNNPINTSYQLLWEEVKENSERPVSPNTLRRILEWYFKILGNISLDKISDSFKREEKNVCRALLSWAHSNSHGGPIMEDLFISDQYSQKASLKVFKEIFEKTNHAGHYSMMMGEN